MRIAFIVGEFPAVSQTFILRQITGLLDRGHDVAIFAHIPGKERSHRVIEEYDLLKRTVYLNTEASSASVIRRVAGRLAILGANFHKNPLAVLRTFHVLRFGKSALSLGVLRSVAPFLGKGPYDIVHCQFGPLGNLGVLLKDTRILRGKLVTSFRGYDASSFMKRNGRRVYQDLFSRGDLFLAVSQHIKGKLARLGCDPRKIIVHRSGVEVKRPDLLLPGPKSNGTTRIVSIARLVEKKGIEYGVQAVATILGRRRKVEYNIAGDGPLREKLQSQIRELNAVDHIRLLGWKTQAEIAAMLKDSDILLAPSVTAENGDEEGIPGVIMEAFAHGLPVVSTYHAGIPEVVQDGDSGFLVREREPDALAESLERLLDDPELRMTMGRNGRTFVEEHCDVDKLNDRLVKIYQQLLEGQLPPATPQLQISPKFR